MQKRNLLLLLLVVIWLGGSIHNSFANMTCDAFSLKADNSLGALREFRIGNDDDRQVVITCLMKNLEDIDSFVRVASPSDRNRADLLSTVVALNKIMKLYEQEKKLDDFIKFARQNDSIAAVSSLSFGARDQIPDLRLNSMLVLSNIIDNTTVCVPLTQLSDPSWKSQPEATKGRANLLAVTSVVAPWAFKENYQSISTVREAIQSDVSKSSEDLRSTQNILLNVKKRLEAQNEDTNKSFTMDTLSAGLRESCSEYISGYSDVFPSVEKGNLKY